MTTDARQFERKSTLLNGRVCDPENSDVVVDCEIVELSAGGARIKINKSGALTGTISLTIGDLGTYPAVVIWSRPPFLGLQFQESAETMSEVVMAVALYR